MRWDRSPLPWLLGFLAIAAGNDGTALPVSPLYARAGEIPQALADNSDATRGNWVSIIDDGYDALLLRVHLIRNAQHSICVQTMILQNDECGRLMMYELIQAAKRGVKVRLLADQFMSSRDRKWVAFLATAHPNLELKYYRPPADHINPPRVVTLLHGVLAFRAANQRMHNKIMLFDDTIVITGGRNIDNHYYNHSTSYNFIDRDVMVIGPVVPTVAASFEEYWEFRRCVPAQKLVDVAAVIRKGAFDRPETREEFQFNGFFSELDREAGDPDLIRERFAGPFRPANKVEFLADSPGKNRTVGLWGGGKGTRRIRKLMRSTDDNLVFQSPYLILSWSGRRGFRKLHRRHPEVQVTVSTNSYAATDNTLAYAANYKLRSTYIQDLGWRIYEFKPHPDDLLTLLPNYPDLERRAREASQRRAPFLSVHAKSFVRDDRIAYIGSYNMDPRSDNLNTEAGLLIEDENIARALKETILRATRPESSWVIAKSRFPLANVNYLIEGLSGLSPVDLWPLRNTSSFELIQGKEPVPPGHEDFYENYQDAGSFPGAEGLSTKEIVTSLYKIFGGLAIPVL